MKPILFIILSILTTSVFSQKKELSNILKNNNNSKINAKNSSNSFNIILEGNSDLNLCFGDLEGRIAWIPPGISGGVPFHDYAGSVVVSWHSRECLSHALDDMRPERTRRVNSRGRWFGFKTTRTLCNYWGKICFSWWLFCHQAGWFVLPITFFVRHVGHAALLYAHFLTWGDDIFMLTYFRVAGFCVHHAIVGCIALVRALIDGVETGDDDIGNTLLPHAFLFCLSA